MQLEKNVFLNFKGRSSNSGHYVGWSKDKKTNQWFMFDDEDVTPMEEEDILKLSGGGDWHTAYVLFYCPRKLGLKFTMSDYKLEGMEIATKNETTADAEAMDVKKD